MTANTVSVAAFSFSPLGRVWVAAGSRGVRRVHLGGGRAEFLQILRREGFHPASGAWARAAARQLREYLAGKRRRFTLELAPPRLTRFQRLVYRALQRVPYGSRVTYGELARQAGFPGAARAVGRAMAANPLPLLWPCHRVVGAAGLGGFGAGLAAKHALIRLEARVVTSRSAR